MENKEIYLALAEKWVNYDPLNKLLPQYNQNIRNKQPKQFDFFNQLQLSFIKKSIPLYQRDC